MHRRLRTEFDSVRWLYAADVQHCGAVGEQRELSFRMPKRSMHWRMYTWSKPVQWDNCSDMQCFGPVAERSGLSVRLLGRRMHRGLLSKLDAMLFRVPS